MHTVCNLVQNIVNIRTIDGLDSDMIYGSISDYTSGVVFAGQTLDDNYIGLYLDNRGWTDVEDEVAEEELPGEFSLLDNYPNPFNPETKIMYTVGKRQTRPVSLRIYNVLGQVVRTLVNSVENAGFKSVQWDGKNESGEMVSSGVYIYKIMSDEFSQARKLMLLK